MISGLVTLIYFFVSAVRTSRNLRHGYSHIGRLADALGSPIGADLMPKGTAYVSTVKLTGPSSPAGCDPTGSPACTTMTAQVEFSALIDDPTLEPTSATVSTLLRSLQAGCDNETADASAIVRPSHYRSSIDWTVEDCATFSVGTVQLMMTQGDLIEPEEEDEGGWIGVLVTIAIIGCGCFCVYSCFKVRHLKTVPFFCSSDFIF
eukprot:SAG31_NODE_10548_length_1126_cov_0.878286_1_plen_205_part_00